MSENNSMKKFTDLNNNETNKNIDDLFKLSKKSVWLIKTETNGDKMDIKCWNKYMFNFEFQINNIINEISKDYNIDINDKCCDLIVKTEGYYNVIRNVPLIDVGGVILPNIIVKKLVNIYDNLFD